MKYSSMILLFVLSLTVSLQIYPESHDLLSDQAEKAFRSALEGDSSFLRAASLYADISKTMALPKAAVYYNLANSLQLAGESTAALSVYSKALSLRPGDSGILKNRNILLESLDIPIPVFRFSEYLLWGLILITGPLAVWLILFLLLIFLLIITILPVISKAKHRRFFIYILLVPSVYLSLSLITWEKREGSLGVISGTESSLRKGDSLMYESLSDLKAGTEVLILETRSGWSNVRTDSQTGWIERERIQTADEVIEKFR